MMAQRGTPYLHSYDFLSLQIECLVYRAECSLP